MHPTLTHSTDSSTLELRSENDGCNKLHQVLFLKLLNFMLFLGFDLGSVARQPLKTNLAMHVRYFVYCIAAVIELDGRDGKACGGKH